MLNKKVIRHINQVSPKWITKVLKKGGHLENNKVTVIERTLSKSKGYTSDRFHLNLTFKKANQETPPGRLFIKIGYPEYTGVCYKEVEFYARTDLSADLPLLKCYNSAFSFKPGGTYLLFEDLSETHFTPDLSESRTNPYSKYPLSEKQYEGAINCLASIHSHWWNRPGFRRMICSEESKKVFAFFVESVGEKLGYFFDYLGDKISSKVQKLYESILAAYPTLYWNYIDNGAQLTIVHGDAHFENFMFPRNQDNGHIVLLDWQIWRVDVGCSDLAHMMTLGWFPNQRKLLEKRMLRHYHKRLVQHGINNYSWEDCWYDYRLGAIRSLFMPVHFLGALNESDVLWALVRKSNSAYVDLECEELLDL